MFTKVDALIWSDTKYRVLSDDGKLLFFYVLTCSHRNILGFYRLPVQYGAYDMNWEMERFDKGLQELLGKGFINYNFNTNIILIPNYLKYNPLENQNQVKGAIKTLSSIPANGLDVDMLNVLEGLGKPFIKPLIEQFHKRLGKQVDVYVDVEVDVKEEVEEETIPIPKTNYKEVYEHYLSLDLIKHRAYTKDISKAIKKAMEDNNYSIEYCKTLLDRHKQVVEITKNDGQYSVQPRPITQFFGQKVKNATHLICSEYEEGGKYYEKHLKGKGEVKQLKPLTIREVKL